MSDTVFFIVVGVTGILGLCVFIKGLKECMKGWD